MSTINFYDNSNCIFTHQFCLLHNKKVLFIRYKGHYNWQLLTEYLDYNEPESDMPLLKYMNYALEKRLNIKVKKIEGIYKHINDVEGCLSYQKTLKYNDKYEIDLVISTHEILNIDKFKILDDRIEDYIWLSKEDLENDYYIDQIEKKLALDLINFNDGILPTSTCKNQTIED